MASVLFPSGQWAGFYTYRGHARKFLMDLMLEFSHGRMHGEGADGIGFFIIAGAYSEKTLDCHWDKTYVGRHTVAYQGYRDGKGIWGTWSLNQIKGGFHIWPLKDGPPPDLREKEEEKELVVAAPGTLPQTTIPLRSLL